MSEKVIFPVQSRTIVGRATNELRRQGLIPANISDSKNSLMVAFTPKAFGPLYERVGETGLLYLKIDDKKDLTPALISEVQRHPVSDRILHVAFREVSLKEKVTASIPVVLSGEVAVKETVPSLLVTQIEVEAFPQDLPEEFVVDVATLTEVGQMVTYEQLVYDKSKVTLHVAADQMATAVVLLQQVKEQAEVSDETPVTEIIGEAAAGAEGAAAGAQPTAGAGAAGAAGAAEAK